VVGKSVIVRSFKSTNMKKLIAIGTCVLLLNLSALTQGTILLQNFGPGFTGSGVRDRDGSLIPAGSSQYTIELLAGTTAGSVAPFFTPITTTTWVGNGWFGVGDPEKALPGYAAGTFPFFQLRAWKNTGGINSYSAALVASQAGSYSPVFQLISGGGLNGLGKVIIRLANPTASYRRLALNFPVWTSDDSVRKNTARQCPSSVFASAPTSPSNDRR